MRQSPNLKLTHVVDIDADARRRDRARTRRRAALTDYRELAGQIDLASVAAPGIHHHAIASELLRVGRRRAGGKADGRDSGPRRAILKAIAERGGRILQIGHLERFNPAIVRLRSILKAPRFVECHRLAPFTERGTDVDVVLDLMVHDLDVILSATGAAEAVSLEALGVAVLTDQIDVANARIRFDNGLIANLNTSRVAPRRERKIRFFQPDAYISVDYEARRIQIYRKSPPPPGAPFRPFRPSRSTWATAIR